MNQNQGASYPNSPSQNSQNSLANKYGLSGLQSQESSLKPVKRVSTPEIDSVQKMISEISSGLRILEDRYYNLRKKTQITDQSLLELQKAFSKEKRILAEEVVETKMKLQQLLEDIDLMKAELKEAVRQKDFKVIEKYLDMWEPMQFVTRKEVEDLLEQTLNEKAD